MPGDVLEWITWGGGGLGDPLTRPASIVAKEVHQRLVTFDGAARNYGVVVKPDDFSINEGATEELRQKMRVDRKTTGWDETSYDRGGTIKELMASCKAETGMEPPRPQWERNPYGPHVQLEYVKKWYEKMRKTGGWELDDVGKLAG
jgi:5-oxoprolinase (ATP-hydrolysing)